MMLKTEPYTHQVARWPKEGKVILAQYDADSVIVYQAYRPSIGHFAARHGFFGGDFKLGRMSWIKPNFLWMMYRSGWGTKLDQEITLAIRIQRTAFDTILSKAVHSTYQEHIYETFEKWRVALRSSDVRIQWDPDHHPSGAKVTRRAIQLGLRGEILKSYAGKWILDIQDISEFVADQRRHAFTGDLESLLTPSEDIYPFDHLP